jgi:hypothetical protein
VFATCIHACIQQEIKSSSSLKRELTSFDTLLCQHTPPPPHDLDCVSRQRALASYQKVYRQAVIRNLILKRSIKFSSSTSCCLTSWMDPIDTQFPNKPASPHLSLERRQRPLCARLLASFVTKEVYYCCCCCCCWHPLCFHLARHH